MTQVSDNMARVALDYIAAGKAAALATVVSTWGSAPRPVGAMLAIAEDGAFQGSVSGGCVEGAVILAAQEALQDGKCRVLDYGVADSDAFAVGLACGGNIRILVEPVGRGDGPDQALVEDMAKAVETRTAFACQVDLETWQRQRLDAAAQTCGLKDGVYTHVINPSLRMIIVGAVHISQNLSPMARMAGYDVILVDPRDSFATHARFPGDVFVDAWPDAALREIGLDAHTAVITLTHDPKIDTPALGVALRSKAFYIGALGSRKTHAKRVAELHEQGFSEAEIAKIHAPVGLNIGAKTPSEIAVSILAEVTECLRHPEMRR